MCALPEDKLSISVVITCYNEENYVGQAIQSVLDQSRYDIIKEIIVVDDGSTDHSEEVIRAFRQKSKKVSYVSQENQGLAVSRNTGLRRVTSNYVAFLDGDDIWVKDKLEIQAKVLQKYPDVGLIYTDTIVFDNAGSERRVYSRRYQYEEANVLVKFFMNGGPVVPSTTIVSLKAFQTVGLFDPDLRKAQDTDMWLRILDKYRIQHIDLPLVKRRIHDASLSADHDKKREYMMKVTDKIVNLIPELQPYRKRRLAMLDRQSAKAKLLKGERVKALRRYVSSFKHDPINLKSYLLLIVYLLPLPMSWYKNSLRK